MNLLFILLSFCCGLLAIKHPVFCIPFVLLLVRVFQKKKIFIFIGGAFLCGLIMMTLSNFRATLPFSEELALVTKTGRNHIIIWTLKGKFYVKVQGHSLIVGDIIFIRGNTIPYFFKSLEGEFNYGKYLANKGIKWAFDVRLLALRFPSVMRLFKGFFNKSVIYPRHLENIKTLLLTRSINYDDPFLKDILRLDLLFLISLTGAHLSFLRRLVKKISGIFVNEVRQEIISYVCLLPLFILNITKFAFYRIYIGGLLRFLNKKKFNATFNRVELTSIACFLFLFTNPYFIYDPAFYLAYILTFLFILIRPSNTIKGRLQSTLILFSVIVPYKVFTTGTFNLLYVFMPLLLVPLLGLWYLLYFVTLFLGPLKNIPINILNFVYYLIELMKKSDVILYFGDVSVISKFIIIILIGTLLYSLNSKIKPLQKNVGIIMAGLLLLSLLPVSHYFEYAVSFINVGQGDSTLLRIKNKYVLIDTGGLTYKDVGNDILIPYLKRNKVFHLDYLIITHEDFDHNGAMDTLVRNFPVKNVITERTCFPLAINGITLQNLNNRYYDDVNLESLIIYVPFPKLNLLLMGDAGVENEEELLKTYPSLAVDVLKVGHHGSNTSTSDEFIKALRPQIAIISCGYQNNYGHPHASVLATLTKYEVIIKRTDLDGTISLKSSII